MIRNTILEHESWLIIDLGIPIILLCCIVTNLTNSIYDCRKIIHTPTTEVVIVIEGKMTNRNRNLHDWSLRVSDGDRLPVNLTSKITMLEHKTIVVHGRSNIQQNLLVTSISRNLKGLLGSTTPIAYLEVNVGILVSFCLADNLHGILLTCL